MGLLLLMLWSLSFSHRLHSGTQDKLLFLNQPHCQGDQGWRLTWGEPCEGQGQAQPCQEIILGLFN